MLLLNSNNNVRGPLLTFNQHSLSDNARAREALRQCLPEPLGDATFSSVLRDDAATKRCLAQLHINLSTDNAGMMHA